METYPMEQITQKVGEEPEKKSHLINRAVNRMGTEVKKLMG